MKVTFDPALCTDRDWVRAQIGDQIIEKAVLDDETIDAILAQGPNKWFAAANCGAMILVRWQAASGGKKTKKVDTLSIEWAGGSGKDSDYRAHLAWLRAQGAAALLGTVPGSGSVLFRVL